MRTVIRNQKIKPQKRERERETEKQRKKQKQRKKIYNISKNVGNQEVSILNKSIKWLTIFEQFGSSYQNFRCGPSDIQQFQFQEFIPIDVLIKVAKIYKYA